MKEMKSLSLLRYLFFPKVKLRILGIPFVLYVDTITKLREALDCLMSGPDLWPDTSASQI